MNILLTLAQKLIGFFLEKPNREKIQKAEALMKIADLHQVRFHKSRDIEWRVNFSFWVLLVVAGGFILDKFTVQSLCHCEFLILAAPLAVTVVHAVWLYKIQESQELDKRTYFKCRDKALELIGSLEVIGRTTEADLKTHRAWAFIAAAVTFMVSTGVVVLLLLKPPATVSMTSLQRDGDLELQIESIYPLKLTPAESLLGSRAFFIRNDPA